MFAKPKKLVRLRRRVVKVNIDGRLPRNKEEKIRKRIKVKETVAFYNKYGDAIVNKPIKVYTEEDIRKNRKKARDRLYYQRNKKHILGKKRTREWRKRLGKATFLNEPFAKCEGHHISRDYIVFIPKELHRSVWHNLKTGNNIVKMNKLVCSYLYNEQKYDELARVREQLENERKSCLNEK
jgi:hypothetical protein